VLELSFQTKSSPMAELFAKGCWVGFVAVQRW